MTCKAFDLPAYWNAYRDAHPKQKGVPLSKEEAQFLEPYWKQLESLGERKKKDREVKKIKDALAGAYIEHFKLAENLKYWEDRAKQSFHNRKRNIDLPPPETTCLAKRDKTMISQFFEKQTERSKSAKALYYEENKQDIEKHHTDLKATSCGTRQGLYAKARKDAFEALPPERRYEYENRAKEINAEKAKNRASDLPQEAIQENQHRLGSALEGFIGSLPGRRNEFSVGDAIFHLEYAYLSAVTGEIEFDRLSTSYCGKTFVSAQNYKNDRWMKFARHALTRKLSKPQPLPSSSPSTVSSLMQESAERSNVSSGPESRPCDYSQTSFVAPVTSKTGSKAKPIFIGDDGEDVSPPPPRQSSAPAPVFAAPPPPPPPAPPVLQDRPLVSHQSRSSLDLNISACIGISPTSTIASNEEHLEPQVEMEITSDLFQEGSVEEHAGTAGQKQSGVIIRSAVPEVTPTEFVQALDTTKPIVDIQGQQADTRPTVKPKQPASVTRKRKRNCGQHLNETQDHAGGESDIRRSKRHHAAPTRPDEDYVLKQKKAKRTRR